MSNVGKKDSKGMKSPLYESGHQVGQVEGPKGGKDTPDSLGYCKHGSKKK
jgi:hypothetical protein